MKCKVCGGAGVIQGQAPGLVSCCTACDGKGFIEQTNEQWLRQCNTEQLAEEIYECVMTHPWHISKEVILEWLKQPHLTSK